ncbi:MAG: MaoC family dehydratase N-terminal domain-containing protein [Microbacterium sp.]
MTDAPIARAEWMSAWDALIAQVGTQIDSGVRWGPDPVEAGAVRRYLDPIELDCELHTDRDAARAHGYPDIIAPYTAVWSLLFEPLRPGGAPLYGSDDRDAPALSGPGVGDDHFDAAPPTERTVGASISMEFARPLVVGERVGAGPRTVVACVPKETRLGRGAFVTFERDVVVGTGEAVCTIRSEIFLYDPVVAAEGADE